MALTFVSLPFVVRTVQPVLEEMDTELEQAAATLGANRFQTVFRVVLPTVTPALLTGFALALARSIGEYGSVIFIAGNIPYVSEIAPLLIVIRLEEFNYAGATAVASLMLISPSRSCSRSTSSRPGAAGGMALALDTTLEAARPWRPCASRRPSPTDESPAVKWTLIAVAMLFLALVLFLPLVAVFVEALRGGVDAFRQAITDPDALAAIKLTLTVAAIAVP